MKKITLFTVLIIIVLIILLVLFYNTPTTKVPQHLIKETSIKQIMPLKKKVLRESVLSRKNKIKTNNPFSLPPCEFAKKLHAGKIDFDEFGGNFGVFELYSSFQQMKKLTTTGIQIDTDREEYRFHANFDSFKDFAPRMIFNIYKNKKNIKTIKTTRSDNPYNEMLLELLQYNYESSDYSYLDKVLQEIKTYDNKDLDGLFEYLERIDTPTSFAHIHTKRQFLSRAETKNEILLALHILKEIKPLDLSPLVNLKNKVQKKKHKKILMEFGKKILNGNQEVEHPYLTVKEHLAVAKDLIKDLTPESKKNYLKREKYQDNYSQHEQSGCDERFLTDLCDIFCK